MLLTEFWFIEKGEEKETKETEENSWQVQRNASIRASQLQTDLQSSKDSFTLTVGKQNVHHFSSMQRINQFSHLTGVRLGWR